MNPPKIMIVEDSEAVAKLVASVLAEKKYDIVNIVDNGEDAIKSVRKIVPDLILMDIELRGGIDGIEAAKKINSECDLPVVFLTSIKNTKNLDRIKEAAPYAFLSKPFKSSDLLYTVETSLYKHKIFARVKESEEHFRLIFENSMDGIFLAEPNGNIISVNPAGCRMFGRSEEEIISLGRDGIIDTTDRQFLDGYALRERTGHFSGEWTGKKANGDKFPVEVTSIIFTDHKNRKRSSTIIRDITERKKADKKIKSARDEIQSLLSSLVTILIGISIRDKVIYWNKIAETTFGIPASDVLGTPLTQCKINWNWAQIYESIYQSISDDKQVRLTNLHFTDSENNIRFLDITINPVKDKDNNFKGFILTGEDITKRKHMELQLSHAQKMKSIGELSSGIAHEINTPTQYITDNTYFLKDSFILLKKMLEKNNELINTIKNGDSTEAIINEIKTMLEKNDVYYIINEIPKAISQSIEGLSRVAKIVQSMKNFAHPEYETKIGVDINMLLEDTVNISRNKWKYVSDVTTHFDKHLPSVHCLPGELNQVFLNIIINAVDAIEEKISNNPKQKGIIDISTAREGKWITITIKDTGAGIPENTINYIFDPFFTTKKVGKGSGQGLTIAYDIIVNKHNGTIEYESTTGTGTTCMIKIPINEIKSEGDF